MRNASLATPAASSLKIGLMNNYPKLHNAMWPGLVGKGPGSEPFINLDTMLELTALAESDGARFDGVDLCLADPHTSIE
jgi:hypothetical protein